MLQFNQSVAELLRGHGCVVTYDRQEVKLDFQPAREEEWPMPECVVEENLTPAQRAAATSWQVRMNQKSKFITAIDSAVRRAADSGNIEAVVAADNTNLFSDAYLIASVAYTCVNLGYKVQLYNGRIKLTFPPPVLVSSPGQRALQLYNGRTD